MERPPKEAFTTKMPNIRFFLRHYIYRGAEGFPSDLWIRYKDLGLLFLQPLSCRFPTTSRKLFIAFMAFFTKSAILQQAYKQRLGKLEGLFHHELEKQQQQNIVQLFYLCFLDNKTYKFFILQPYLFWTYAFRTCK